MNWEGFAEWNISFNIMYHSKARVSSSYKIFTLSLEHLVEYPKH